MRTASIGADGSRVTEFPCIVSAIIHWYNVVQSMMGCVVNCSYYIDIKEKSPKSRGGDCSADVDV